jgi:RNA polymerase primary sigma factor
MTAAPAQATVVAAERRGRQLDRELARLLGESSVGGQRLPGARTEALVQRVRVKPALELRLVLAAQARRPHACRALVEAFEPLIASVARVYRHSASVDRAELMQAGVVGLLRALERYDAEIGTPFWAYAAWWVRQAMQQLVSEVARPMVLSDRALRQLARVQDARRQRTQAQGREPTAAELAADTGLTPEQVQNLSAAERRPRALEEPTSGSGEGRTCGESIVDPRAEDAYDRVPWHAEIPALEGWLGALSERERTIVSARFGLHGREHTLRELASTLGVSAERVRQIEERALDKLRLEELG